MSRDGGHNTIRKSRASNDPKKAKSSQFWCSNPHSPASNGAEMRLEKSFSLEVSRSSALRKKGIAISSQNPKEGNVPR